ncbi:MAG: hypothetical protein WCJ94_06300 [bacterium]
MNQVLTFVIVTGAWFLIEAVIGFFLGTKKPYNVVLLVIHGILTVFVIAGVISSIYGLAAVTFGKTGSEISLHAASLALLVIIISGIRLSVSKKDSPGLVLVHKLSAFVLAISLITGIIFIIVKI